mgnify:CR=1 FL=1
MKYLVWNECYSAGGADWSLIELITHWGNPNDEFLVFVNESHKGLPLLKDKLVNKANLSKYKSPQDISNRIMLRRNIFLDLIRKVFLSVISMYFIFFKLRKIIVDTKPGIILINNGGFPGALSNFLLIISGKLFSKCKIVMIVRNYPPELFENSLYVKICSFICNYFLNGVVAVSNSLKDSLAKDARIKPENLKTIYNGVSIENKTSNLDGSKYTYTPHSAAIIGALDERKGHEHLFEAWKYVVQEFPEAKLYVVGSTTNSNYKNLKNQAKRCHIESNIEWVEFTNNVGSIYKVVDVVIVPSIAYESLGRVAAEALAFKKTVIVNSFGGLKEIIDDPSLGYCLDVKNTTKFKNAIIKILNDDALREKLSENGHAKYKEKFTSEVMAKKYLEYIISV